MIFLGILVFSWAFLRDPGRKKLISTDDFFDIMSLGVGAALIGGRLLFLLTNSQDMTCLYDCIAVWDGGLSLLGAILAIFLVLPWCFYAKKLPVLKLMDLIAVYVPLLQSISRIGCFMAGCCYGCQTSVPWAIERECALIHPTQIYSSVLLFIIFIVMKYGAHGFFKKPGQLVMLYLILENMERFFIDFLRGDREFFTRKGYLSFLSIHQIIALAFCVIALIVMYIISLRARHTYESF
jgi:phosphatidylglycerol:prolipoprotein diacylglycerol transferase